MQRRIAAVRQALFLPACISEIVCAYDFYLQMRFTTIEKHALDCALVGDKLVVVTATEVRVLDTADQAVVHCMPNTAKIMFALGVGCDRVALFSLKKCSLHAVRAMQQLRVVDVDVAPGDFHDRVGVLGGRIYYALHRTVMEIDFHSARWQELYSEPVCIRSLGVGEGCLVVSLHFCAKWYRVQPGVWHVRTHGGPFSNFSFARCCRNETSLYANGVATVKGVSVPTPISIRQWAPLADGTWIACSATHMFCLRNHVVWTKERHHRDIKKMWALPDGRLVCFGPRVCLLE